MTPDEIAVLPIGTEVLVRGELGETHVHGTVSIHFGDARIVSRGLRIHSIAPPRPLAVGDRADWGNCAVTILAIDGTLAWVTSPAVGHITCCVSNLTRI